MSKKQGYSGKAYKASAALADALAATATAATWTEWTGIISVNEGGGATSVDATTRANSGYKQTDVVLIDVAFDIEIFWDPSDTILVALQTAYHARTEVAMAFMDGAIATTGSNGRVSNFKVTKFLRDEPIDGLMMCHISVASSSCTSNYTK